METSVDKERRIRREHRKFLQAKGVEARERRGKAIRWYKQGIMEGRSPNDIIPEIMGRLDVKKRSTIERWLSGEAVHGNANANALTEGRVLVWLQNLESDVSDIRANCDDALDQLDSIENNEEMTYPKEIIRATGVKEGTTIKEVPLHEAKHMILARKADALERFFKAVRDLRGNTVMVNIDQTGGHLETMGDLAHRIKDLEGRHKIEGGLTTGDSG